VASLLCGVSTSSLMLNLCRGVQGVGGAIMFATSLALIASAFQGRDRGTAFGIFGAVTGGAVAIGPLVGGAITSGIGWRWIFFVNVPIGAVALLVTLTRIAESRDPHTRRVDWIGFFSFSLSLFALVLGLVRGNDDGWSSSKIVGLFIAAVVLMLIFFVNESRSKDPMLPLSLFRKPAVVGVSFVAFCMSASIFAMFLYLTFYLQDALGNGPLGAGLRYLPLTLLSFFVAYGAGQLTVRMPSRYLLGGGMLLIAIGLFLMTHTHANSGWTVLLPGFIVSGAGIGTVNPVLASAAISVVPPEESGMASGTNNTFRQVGIATGIAVLGAIFQSQIVSHTTATLQRLPNGPEVLRRTGAVLNSALASGDVRPTAAHLPPSLSSALLTAYQSGFSVTMNHLMLISTFVALVGSVAGFSLVRQRDFVVPTGGGAPAAAHA
jgi:EmrB/QacA subfamily drug resistance transporter